MVIPLFFSGSGGTGSDEVTATSNQVLKGYTAVTNDSDDEPIEGTIVSEEGKTVYATSSDQVIIDNNRYVINDIILNALSQTNLDPNNILRGKTISISNGLTNVWNITGNTNIYRYINGSIYITTNNWVNIYSTLGSTNTQTSAHYENINPGITPVIAFYPNYVSFAIFLTGKNSGYLLWNKAEGSYVSGMRTIYQTSAEWRSDCVSVIGESGYTVNYWIIGY